MHHLPAYILPGNPLTVSKAKAKAKMRGKAKAKSAAAPAGVTEEGPKTMETIVTEVCTLNATDVSIDHFFQNKKTAWTWPTPESHGSKGLRPQISYIGFKSF